MATCNNTPNREILDWKPSTFTHYDNPNNGENEDFNNVNDIQDGEGSIANTESLHIFQESIIISDREMSDS